MASRFWVGGNGNWTDVAHWSTSSGGGGGAAVPTPSDEVYTDANSGNPVITVPAVAAAMKSLRHGFGTIQDTGVPGCSFTVDEDAEINGGNLNLTLCQVDIGSNFRTNYALRLLSGSVSHDGTGLGMVIGSLHMSGGTMTDPGGFGPIVANSLSSNEMAILIDGGAFVGSVPFRLTAPSTSGRQIVRDDRLAPFKNISGIEVNRPFLVDAVNLVGSLKIRYLNIVVGAVYHGTVETPQQIGDTISYEGGTGFFGFSRIWVQPWGGLDYYTHGSAGTTNVDLTNLCFVSDGWGFLSGGTVNYYNTNPVVKGRIMVANDFWWDYGTTTITTAGLFFVQSAAFLVAHGVSYWNDLTILNGGGLVWFARDAPWPFSGYAHVIRKMEVFGAVTFARGDNIHVFETGQTVTVHPGGAVNFGHLFDAFSVCYIRSGRRDPTTLAITLSNEYCFLNLMLGGTVTPVFTDVRDNNAGAGEIIYACYPATPNTDSGNNINWWFCGDGAYLVPVELWLD